MLLIYPQTITIFQHIISEPIGTSIKDSIVVEFGNVLAAIHEQSLPLPYDCEIGDS
jgi:hypothetical protein